MPGLRINRIAPMVAEDEGLEATYGVDPTLDPTADGFLTLNSPNPAQPQMNNVDFTPHNATFKPVKSIPTDRLMPVRFTTGLQSEGTDTPPRFNDVLTMCGLTQTIQVATSVTYKLSEPAEVRSSTLAVELGGLSASWVHEINGVYGNAVFRGTPNGGFLLEVDGAGLFQNPQAGTLQTLYTNPWVGGTNNLNKFSMSGANRLTINNGAAYVPILKAFEFDLGIQIESVLDANSGATFGIFRQLVIGAEPRLRLTIALDTDPAAGVSYLELYQDADAGTTHDVDMTYTDLASNTIRCHVAEAQLLTVRPAEDGGHGTVIVEYKPQGTTPYEFIFA